MSTISAESPSSGQLRPIFIGGTGRSGTTILGKLLGHHHDVCLSKPIEARYITDNHGLIDQALGKRNAKRSIRRRILQTVFSERSRIRELAEFEKLLLTKWWSKPSKTPGYTVGLEHAMPRETLLNLLEAFKTEHQDDKLQATRQFLFGAIRSQANYSGQSIWIDTSPPNIENCSALLEIWPESRFIYIKRDGRDTAASIAAERWGPNNPLDALEFWAERERKANLAASKLNQNQLLTISLEDLAVSARNETYELVLEFLGIEDQTPMRHFFENSVLPQRAEPGLWVNRVPNPEDFERYFYKISRNLGQT